MAKEPIALRPLDAGDDAALLAIQHATTGDTPAWSPALLQQLFRDPAHRGGANAVVAQRTGTIVGAAGWVAAGPEFFGSPVLAIDEETADVLIDDVIERARQHGSAWIRITTTTGEPHKVAALIRRGFAGAFDFVTLARTSSDPPRSPEPPLRRVALEALPIETLRALDNATFRDVPSSPLLTVEGVAHLLSLAWSDGSGVWLGKDGEPIGFVVAIRGDDERGPFATVDAVGVLAAHRRGGLGRAMLGHLIAAADRAGLPEVRSLVASSNTASMVLHARAGFTEVSRRRTWQLDL